VSLRVYLIKWKKKREKERKTDNRVWERCIIGFIDEIIFVESNSNKIYPLIYRTASHSLFNGRAAAAKFISIKKANSLVPG